MKNNRDVRIDELRGVLMILVVMGHCIQYVADPMEFDHNFFFRAIYSFHMPMFMCLSGYVAQMVHPHMTMRQLLGRISSLLIPFLSWGIISVIKDQIPYYNIIFYPEKGLWFLWVLAFINALVFFIELFPGKIKFAIYFCVQIILMFSSFNRFGIGLVRLYFLWYSVGFLLPEYWKKFSHKSLIRAIGIIGWPIAATFWMRNAEPLFADKIQLIGIKGRIFDAFCSIYRLYLTPLFGIIFVWTIFGKIWKYIRGSFLKKVGANTIAIYALQYYCWVKIFDSTFINTACSFGLALIIPMLFTRIISHSKILSLLLLGRICKNSQR